MMLNVHYRTILVLQIAHSKVKDYSDPSSRQCL